ncbi:MAG: efflux RND transporter periplasmic adaptor subunit [Planctomycetota bacterium]
MPLTVVIVLASLVFLDTSTLNIGTDSHSKLLWAESEEVEYEYFCGMHPQVVSDQPGKCPLCGMPLSKRAKAGAMVGEEELPEVPIVQLSPRQVRLAGVKVEPVEYRSLVKTIYTVGTITYDERLLDHVTAWVAGRVDKLFVDFTGVEVAEGAPLVWIYSPDLVSTQQEYLLALETQEKMKNSTLKEIVRSTDYLLEATRDRLLLWGITDKQIEKLAKTGNVEDHMTIYAPITGTVIKKDVLEGQYVEEGTKMYTIADLTNLWMMAEVYEYEMGLVKLGQDVEITTAAFHGQTFIGEVSFIDPFLDETTRSVKVRVDVPNSDLKLKPAMFVNATIKVPLGESEEEVYYCPVHPDVTSTEPGVCEECGGMELIKKPIGVLSIPRSAVLDTGRRKLVYVEREKDLFEAREIKTGFVAEGYVEVLEGLKEGEIVVAAGAFLIDAESQLGPGVGAQYFGATGGPEGEEDVPSKEKAPPKGHRH